MLKLKIASLTVTSLLLFLSAGCSNSSQPQNTPASPAVTETPTPGLTPINRVKDKVNDAQEKDNQRREETQNP